MDAWVRTRGQEIECITLPRGRCAPLRGFLVAPAGLTHARRFWPGTRANKRRVRDRTRGISQRAAHKPDTCVHEALRSADSTRPQRRARALDDPRRHDYDAEWTRLIRPAAASIRSRGPGGPAPGPHASLNHGTRYFKLLPWQTETPRPDNSHPYYVGLLGCRNLRVIVEPDRRSQRRCGRSIS
jgi:hypothetical protein